MHSERGDNMDLRTDSVNDVLKHYGIPPGTGKTYIAGVLAHKLQFTTPTETRKKEQYEKQRKAELQLYNAKAEKLTSDIKKCSDDISKHYMSSFMEISRQQTAVDNALSKLNEARKTRDIHKISALESAAKTQVNNVNSAIDRWNSKKDNLMKQVTIYDSSVTNLVNQRPNEDYTETLYTSQAVEALQNALNTLVYDRDLLEGTKLYKITM